MTHLIALPGGTELAGDYKIDRVLGAGGFGVTYLADEMALSRKVSIKEYFPSDFAARDTNGSANPRSENCTGDYSWGLERFIEEAQTLAKFNHSNIVRVYRTFRANNTAYMVLHFEEGQSLKSWLKGLNRAPRQKELDAIIAPLLDALQIIHKAEFLHRDIAPDNIIIRKAGDPVLIDFGAARSDIAAHSKTKTVSALVKPGYSPYEQYAETSKQQGPWTDIYALAATLYHAVTGKRPPDSPSRMLKDEMISAHEAALSSYRAPFLDAIQRGLALSIDARPQSVAEWRGLLLAPVPERPGMIARLRERTEIKKTAGKARQEAVAAAVVAPVPPPPDAPGPAGRLLDFLDGLKPVAVNAEAGAKAAPKAPSPTAQRTTAPKAAPQKVAAKAAAVPVAAALPPALPARNSSGRKRARPAPSVKRKRSLSREIKTKIIMAMAFVSAGYLFQDQIARLAQPVPSGITTGGIATSLAERAITQSAEIRAHDGAIDGLALSGDGRLIVTTGSDRQLKIWNAETRQLNGAIALDAGTATSLSVRNNRAVTGHADGTVSVYDLDTRTKLYTFKRTDAGIWASAFAGSEDLVAAAGQDTTIALWQTGTPSAPDALLQSHTSPVQALASDTSGRWLASSSDDSSVKVWNVERRSLRRSLRGSSDGVATLAFSHDGATIAGGRRDGSIKLWSASTGRTLRTINSHNVRVTSIAFAPGGDLLASAAEDGSVRLRGLKRARIYGALKDIGSGAKSVAFSNDGRTLLTGGIDGVVRLWPLPEAQLARRD
ncbi:MAG TPA: serine/threonine-protein kinase [Hyphomicrobium sp.]|nr:serine/threonine-protein kinase [Hyphomicrobium sp.]